MTMGAIGRKAMMLGGSFPRHLDKPTVVQLECDTPPCSCDTPAIRLVQVMRRLDPDLAAMIEALPPAYLVKK